MATLAMTSKGRKPIFPVRRCANCQLAKQASCQFVLGLGAGLHYRQELILLQTRSADQRAIHIGLR